MSTNQSITPRSGEALAEPTEQARVVTPPVDIFESTDELLLFADIPGTPKAGVSLHFEKNRLTLEATAPTVKYRREFAVSSGIDVERTEALVQQGVLRVRLPKLQSLQARRIEVLGG